MSIFNFLSCSNSSTVLEATYNNEKVLVSSVEKKGFSTNTITYNLKLGNRKKVPFNYETTDIYDRPYSNDIFVKATHYFFSDTPAYKNKIDFERKITPTMLYLSPQKYSKDDFESYAAFLKNKWPEVVAEINKDGAYFTKQVIGIVYGSREDFTQYFTGSYNNQPCYFDISPEGMILFHQGVPPNNSGFENVGLTNKVQMPGKRVVFTDTTVFTPEQLHTFKDRHGKSMKDYFVIETAVKQ